MQLATRRSVVAVSIAILASTQAIADVVLDWNSVLLDAIRVDRTAPPRASRAMALVHLAGYDSVIAVQGGHETYLIADSAPVGASEEAAFVGAAHWVLSRLFPAQAATFDAAKTTSLARIADGTAKASGVAWGDYVADLYLAVRANDAPSFGPYEAPIGALWWEATPPAFAPALLPNWQYVQPWTMSSGSQFRGGPPPSPTSLEYTRAFHEVIALGRVDSIFRTADQTQIALFWADGAGTETPPGHWLRIAQGLSSEQGLSLRENARLFAYLGLAVADAAISSWDHKYSFHLWRPVTGIRNADQDGNSNTIADPSWTPLIATPPFPAYTSGHSTFSSASARILGLFFGTDDLDFSTTSDGLPGVVRSYQSLSAAAEEAGQSGIFGGIHWQFDNAAGLAGGKAIAEHVYWNFLQPVGIPNSICAPSPTVACLGDGRFQVEALWNTGTASGSAQADPFTGDSSRFWFFDAENTELTVKVIDACSIFDRFWVFAAGLTDVEVAITVTDTKSGRVKRYFNPRGRAFAPAQDTSAFATCP
jgi:PAP2 superfamily